METIITYGIIYLLIFRLAVILLGGLCIFLGYRLFLLGRQQADKGPPEQGGELHGTFGSSKLIVRSTAPGIFFAAFGAAIVITVLAGSQPDVQFHEKQAAPQSGATGQQPGKANILERSASVRSDPPRSTVPQDAGSASYYHIRKTLLQAVEDGKTAVSLVPDNPDYRDQLARLLFAEGEPDKAAEQQRLAVEKVDAARREDFRTRLDLYEQAARQDGM